MTPRKKSTVPAKAKATAPARTGTNKADSVSVVVEHKKRKERKPPVSFIAYYRVSTQKQGRSGLGLEAQKAAVESYVRERGGKIIAEFTEIESGTNPARPQLAEALKDARRRRAALIVGKLDRLGRKAWHLLKLLDESTIPIRFADAPDADETMLAIMAALAEREAKLIGFRTKEALQVAKARGTKLGSDRPGHWTPERDTARQAGLTKGRAAADKVRRANADSFASDLSEIVLDMQVQGLGLKDIADRLNAEGYPARRGGEWKPSQVHRLLKRLEEIPAKKG